MPARTSHPTRELLLATTMELLQAAEPVTADAVLERSGISRGSMYHHFRDFPDLVDHARTRIFARYVDASIAALTDVMTGSRSKKQLRAGLAAVTEATQSADAAAFRSVRLQVLADATVRPELRELLAVEQQRLTDALADLVREAQERGWYRRELDPAVVAVFIQAYTLGRVVDDVSLTHVDETSWNGLIMSVIDQLFLQP